MRVARERFWLVPHSETHQVSSDVLGNRGDWSSCRSVNIDRRYATMRERVTERDFCLEPL